MNTPTILLEKYQSYSRDEQRVLHVISVIAQPKTISQVRQVLRKLNWQTVDGILLSEFLSVKMRERWAQDGILIFKHNEMRCNSNIAELITRETLNNHSFVEILSVVELLLPDPEPSKSRDFSAYYKVPEVVRLRKIRNAFYLNDEFSLLHLLGITSDTTLHTLDYNDVSYLIQLCTTPFDPELFEKLTDTVKVLVICPLLQKNAYDLSDSQRYYEILQAIYPDVVKKNPSLNCILAQQHLWRGKTDQIETLLVHDDSSIALSLMGWLKFQQSDADTAISYFEAATKSLKKETRKRNIVLPDIAEIIYLFALLQRADKKSYLQINQHVDVMLRATKTHRFERTARKLKELADIQHGQQRFEDCFWINRATGFSETAFDELFHHLILLWAQGKVKPSAKLIKYNQQALQSGWSWYAWVSASLMANKELSTSTEDFLDLSTLFKPIEPWKVTLKALREVNNSGNEQTDDNQADLRMAWGLHYWNQQCMLFPREQKRSARGWTKGRPIALQKLHDQAEQYSYLNASATAMDIPQPSMTFLFPRHYK